MSGASSREQRGCAAVIIRAKGQDVALVRHGRRGDWREPTTTAYTNEAALQKILSDSPALIYGVERDNALVAQELYIAGTGYLDLAVIQLDGTITLVECKLGSNPEIWREIVGQIVAYAAAMSSWTADDLAASWLTTTKHELLASALELAERVGAPFDQLDFVRQLGAALSAGRFRLVLAVDHATAELKRIIEFLNRRTADDLQVLCVEFDYIADGEVEVLIPNHFGVESAERKASRRGQHTEQAFREVIASHCSSRLTAAIDLLLEHAKHRADFDHAFWGEGAAPSLTVKFSTAQGPIYPWAFYPAASSRPLFAINFDWMHQRGNGVPDARMAEFRDAIAALPGVAPMATGVQELRWAKRPSVPAESLFADPGAVETFQRALDRALDSCAGSLAASSSV